MKTLIFLILTCAVVFLTGSGWACNVCHSKNPKMVRMHTELGFTGCFRCHAPGVLRTGEEGKRQMTTDSLCSGCHGIKLEKNGK